MRFTHASAPGQGFVYSDSGTGPLVILLHGFPDTPLGWENTRTVLNEAGFRTVVPYLRGYHPATIVASRRYRSREIAHDALALLDALGAPRAVLVGHDWGASIAYRAGALAPERVRALCAVAIPHLDLLGRSPMLLWRARHFITLRLPSGRRLCERHDFAYLDTLMRRWAPSWSGPAREQTLADAKRCFADPRVLDAALGYYRDAVPGEALGPLAQPALIVGGTNDIIDRRAFTDSTLAFTGQCEVVIGERTGHWPHREAPDLFHERLLAFLRGLP
jgi:pimeloyl-ACP methyl ester carboxylesterase